MSLSLTAGNDYTLSVFTLIFPKFSGEGTTISFNIPIIDDLFCESTETFDLFASIVDNLGNFTTGGDTATGVIIDNDSENIR